MSSQTPQLYNPLYPKGIAKVVVPKPPVSKGSHNRGVNKGKAVLKGPHGHRLCLHGRRKARGPMSNSSSWGSLVTVTVFNTVVG